MNFVQAIYDFNKQAGLLEKVKISMKLTLTTKVNDIDPVCTAQLKRL